MRLIGLNLLAAALETLGTRILQLESLLFFARTTLCQTILCTSRTQNLFVLSFVTRLLSWLYATMRHQLKMQIELMLREAPAGRLMRGRQGRNMGSKHGMRAAL